MPGWADRKRPSSTAVGQAASNGWLTTSRWPRRSPVASSAAARAASVERRASRAWATKPSPAGVARTRRPLPIKQALGASLEVSAALAVPGTIVHAWLGHVDWAVTVAFALGAVPLSRLGSQVALRSPSPVLERLYGAGLVALGGGMLALAALG